MILETLYPLTIVAFAIALVRCFIEIKQLRVENSKLEFRNKVLDEDIMLLIDENTKLKTKTPNQSL